MATPKYSSLKAHPDVYTPSEDTFFLIDILQETIPKNTLISLEIGSGSGLVSTFISQQLPNSLNIATDINPDASLATRAVSLENNKILDIVNCNFASPLSTRLHKSIDLLVFNPPYVPTPSSEVSKVGIAASWAGGINGRQVIDEFLETVDDLVSDHGLFYLVLVQDNLPLQVEELMKAKGFCCRVFKRSVGWERLFILVFERLEEFQSTRIERHK